MAKTPRHPLSAAWGNMPEEELFELAEDIKAHGCKESVVLFQGMVLDGWHRAQACQIAGIKIPTREFDPEVEGDPRVFVKERNAFRRHLTPAMKAHALVRIAEYNYAPGVVHAVHSRAEIAKEAGVSKRMVQNVVAAEKAGFGDEIASGAMTPGAAVKKIRENRNPSSSRPVEKKPSKDQQHIVDLNIEIADLREKNAVLAAEAQGLADLALDEQERAKKFSDLYRQIDTLESQRDEWMATSNSWQKEAMRLRKQLGYK